MIPPISLFLQIRPHVLLLLVVKMRGSDAKPPGWVLILSLSWHNQATTTLPPHTASVPHTTMGSVVLPHLKTGWHVDQAIMSEDDRLVVIRFGRDWDPDCMRQDEMLYRIADKVKNFAVVYLCDIDEVPDFNKMFVSSHFSLLVDS